jgi:predicted alpha/beta superfamily hydrolase
MRLSRAFWVATCAVPISGRTAVAQQAAPRSFGETKVIELESGRGAPQRRLWIIKPNGEPPSAGFPVIYVLDGSWYIDLVRDMATIMLRSGDMPPVVIVGVGYDDANEARRLRIHDFTTPAPASANPPQWATWNADPGGADAFMAFMSETVRPLVAREVRVNASCQVLVGHSLGGLFAVHSLFHDPALYRAYVIGDPSVWWNANAELRNFPAFIESARSSGKPIDVTLLSSTKPARMPGIDSLDALLRSAQLPGFTTRSRPVDDATHNSMLPAFFTVALTQKLECAR